MQLYNYDIFCIITRSYSIHHSPAPSVVEELGHLGQLQLLPQLEHVALLADVLDGAVGGDGDLARQVVPHQVRAVVGVRLLEEVGRLLVPGVLDLITFYPVSRDTLLRRTDQCLLF